MTDLCLTQRWEGAVGDEERLRDWVRACRFALLCCLSQSEGWRGVCTAALSRTRAVDAAGGGGAGGADSAGVDAASAAARLLALSKTCDQLRAQYDNLRTQYLRLYAELWTYQGLKKLVQEALDWAERPGLIDWGRWFEDAKELIARLPDRRGGH